MIPHRPRRRHGPPTALTPPAELSTGPHPHDLVMARCRQPRVGEGPSRSIAPPSTRAFPIRPAR